jgi:hypothetical protein
VPELLKGLLPIIRGQALTVHFPDTRMVPTSRTCAFFQTGLENTG